MSKREKVVVGWIIPTDDNSPHTMNGAYGGDEATYWEIFRTREKARKSECKPVRVEIRVMQPKARKKARK
jgi:hypothetical protein